MHSMLFHDDFPSIAYCWTGDGPLSEQSYGTDAFHTELPFVNAAIPDTPLGFDSVPPMGLDLDPGTIWQPAPLIALQPSQPYASMWFPDDMPCASSEPSLPLAFMQELGDLAIEPRREPIQYALAPETPFPLSLVGFDTNEWDLGTGLQLDLFAFEHREAASASSDMPSHAELLSADVTFSPDGIFVVTRPLSTPSPAFPEFGSMSDDTVAEFQDQDSEWAGPSTDAICPAAGWSSGCELEVESPSDSGTSGDECVQQPVRAQKGGRHAHLTRSRKTSMRSPRRAKNARPRNPQYELSTEEMERALDSDSLICPAEYCGFTPKARRASDLKRHMRTHLARVSQRRWVCCGVAVSVAAADYGVGRTGRRLACYQYKGETMTGGCLQGFSRRDALIRHLKRRTNVCFWRADMSEQLRD